MPNVVYTENFIAKVNIETNHHEVILRGETSHASLVLNNVEGAQTFSDGATYAVSFSENTKPLNAPNVPHAA